MSKASKGLSPDVIGLLDEFRVRQTGFELWVMTRGVLIERGNNGNRGGGKGGESNGSNERGGGGSNKGGGGKGGGGGGSNKESAKEGGGGGGNKGGRGAQPQTNKPHRGQGETKRAILVLSKGKPSSVKT